MAEIFKTLPDAIIEYHVTNDLGFRGYQEKGSYDLAATGWYRQDSVGLEVHLAFMDYVTTRDISYAHFIADRIKAFGLLWNQSEEDIQREIDPLTEQVTRGRLGHSLCLILQKRYMDRLPRVIYYRGLVMGTVTHVYIDGREVTSFDPPLESCSRIIEKILDPIKFLKKGEQYQKLAPFAGRKADQFHQLLHKSLNQPPIQLSKLR